MFLRAYRSSARLHEQLALRAYVLVLRVVTLGVCFGTDQAVNQFTGHKGTVRHRYSVLHHRADAWLPDQPCSVQRAVGVHGDARFRYVSRSMGVGEG
eukprot:4450235-Pyramimonas_sp.AAC.1